ncbi:MobA/MobL family protein [Methyloceanibacter stevinii]|uniref:MobA/MobL family protein n=1 Tax=Methyloceanibacter stevinii TaxID=1774970 RepID=UPI00114C9F4C|nr:MobA/MobL family protein [Methyloceanibacter stevinii]
MAIYSCNLRSIGRSTHAAGTAGAHILYISRAEAKPVILVNEMPAEPQAARNWLDRAERASRKNARVIDKIRLALPRELSEDERSRLVRDFMEDLAGDARIPWYAAIHFRGKDSHNPHAHIAVHDRDMDSGKRVLRLSDSARDRERAGLPGPKAVEWIRERWEQIGNQALERSGHDVRIDRRTLQAQGIDREPTIHEGPRAQHINDRVKRPASKRVLNGAGRLIDYPAIDRGKTRREFNAQVIDLNLERAVRSGRPETAAWAQFERDQMDKDRALKSGSRASARAARGRSASSPASSWPRGSGFAQSSGSTRAPQPPKCRPSMSGCGLPCGSGTMSSGGACGPSTRRFCPG